MRFFSHFKFQQKLNSWKFNLSTITRPSPYLKKHNISKQNTGKFKIVLNYKQKRENQRFLDVKA